VNYTWQFYAIADARQEMTGRVEYVATPPAGAPPGALFLVPAGAAHARAGWDEVETVSSIDGSRSFVILRRATD
jgi:hypothetical protein